MVHLGTFFLPPSENSLFQCAQVYILKAFNKILSQAKVSYWHRQPKRGGQFVGFDGEGPFAAESVSCVGRGCRLSRGFACGVATPQAADCPLSLGPISICQLCWPDSKSGKNQVVSYLPQII